jgi:hypothetical protein
VTGDGKARALLPASGIPLLYFGFAHLSLAAAFGVMAVRPDLPAGFFHHPRMIAVVHLVTLGWISGSILGAFYIVAPLALRMPLRPGWLDRAACGSFVAGAIRMVSHFWIGEYSGMVWSALLVTAAVLHVAARALAGLRQAPVPWPVKLHVSLAFVNMIAASVFGMVVGMNRLFGWLSWAPVSSAFAHAHLAAIGWAMMMVVGLSYRLIPMIVPAAMPTRSSMARSAVLLEAGLIVLVIALVRGSAWTAAGALLIVAGLASFVREVRAIVAHRLPPPAALPRPDWATWQTHAAFFWLLLAAALGCVLSLPLPAEWVIPLGWTYGTAGLVGFLAQIVVGIQGRLLPLHGWYRGFEAGGMRPPAVSAHALASPAMAKFVFFAWLAGVPVLAAGLVAGSLIAIAAGSVLLLAAVAVNAAQMITVATGAMAPRTPATTGARPGRGAAPRPDQ